MATSPLREVNAGEGATILLLPAEDAETVLAELNAFWDEVDSMFDPGEPLTDDEAAALLDEQAEDDPNYWRWAMEYNAAMSDGAPGDFASGVADVFAGPGIQYCAIGIDWEVVENDRIGD